MGKDESPELRLAKKRLTAEAARKITNETVTPLIHIYDAIKDLASMGLDKLTWDAIDMSQTAKDRIAKQLELDGYKVDISNPSCLDITW